MEISTQHTGFGGYFGSYESGPSFSKDPFLGSRCFDEQYEYDDHEMCYDECSSTGRTPSECNSSSPSISDESDDGCGDDDEPMEDVVFDDDDERIDAGDVWELSASTEMLRIRFPFQSISIRLSDFCCLREQDLLNDTIIDFSLNHIVEHILPDDPERRVTVLPALFWHNLSLLNAANQNAENMNAEQLQAARFGDVLEFVEGFELQDVDYIVIPVNEWEHWSLAVVCHPFTPHGRIVCFDSQLTEDLNNLQNIATLIDDFLKYAWLRWQGREMKSTLPCVIPANLAQQTNNYDCGVYILEFARRFLLAPPKELDAFDFSAQYDDFTIENSREEMQRAVLSMSSNRSLWEPLMELLRRKQ